MKFFTLLIFIVIITFEHSQAFDFSKYSKRSPEAVRALQNFLTSQGYQLGNVDGIAGARTMKALRKFQEDQGITKDGIIGKDTTAAIHKIQPPNNNQGTVDKTASQSKPANTSGDDVSSKAPPGATLGKGATVFGYEKDGSPDKDDKSEAGTRMSCGQVHSPKKCYAAISAKKRKQVCGSATSKCYCGMFATVTFPGKQSIKVPIHDTGIAKGGGEVIDLSGECFNLRNIPTRNANVDKNTIWHISPNQPKGKYIKDGAIKQAI